MTVRQESLFKGSHRRAVEESGRVGLPKAFLTVSLKEAGFDLVKHPHDKCLVGYVSGRFPFEKADKSLCAVFAEAVKPDRNGRFILPKASWNHPEEKEPPHVTFLGFGNYFEIWSPENLDEMPEKFKASQLKSRRLSFT